MNLYPVGCATQLQNCGHARAYSLYEAPVAEKFVQPRASATQVAPAEREFGRWVSLLASGSSSKGISKMSTCCRQQEA